MARVGTSDFTHSYLGPRQNTQYWREVIHRDTWDHPFHPLSERVPKPSYRDLIATSKDAQQQPWKHLGNVFQVGKDDMGSAYLDGRQQPRGFSKADLTMRSHNVLGTSLPSGAVTLDIAKLPTSLKATRSSGSLPMAAKMATMRGDTDLFHRDRAPSVRAPAYNTTLPGWGSSGHAQMSKQPRTRQPSFGRILNV
mmetsp:Transcript_67178/g.118783  ORF Transcript_67178/g.118783 Transcript_67178/m.118783 type:complete len:195 (-) Transcript_67178:94-678(-)|eukprot:CAMPEP_0197620956 /NCGR_PEP_ID=MMETSP1338-20131121/1640_1 /TAXON_ID=43686 ORGANISM="Pelagodinium beii, Strain RCC1491" /NCGR_SAMPLE_ID=MMETSP1338 /ASSEMBLY_ACC=CAM_ASM_000754 /LENGTH=194 /DNA_ID=CAMNT_0043190271 /DNA_START=37 /DNA_END=621 /DNA_ORIENTATION=-